MNNPIIEGVFAIHKPTAITSAQVLRNLQTHLNPSKTFAPWIEAEQSRRDAESHNQKGKRSRKSRRPAEVKMGHGGTLDPMATGVLIVGVGSGTKSLQGFLDGTKTYDAVVVFGAATDSYDSEGKIVKRAPYEHITRSAVEEALAKFRGDIMQKPPIFSALRVQGKRLYEYAREGKEVPVEIKKRPVTVSQLELLEWMEPGTHKYNFPEKEADQEEKDFADKLLRTEAPIKSVEAETGVEQSETDADQNLKRKRDEETQDAETSQLKKAKQDDDQAPLTILAAIKPSTDGEKEAPSEAEQGTTSENVSSQQPSPCAAPAARIRMTVSSGFYVRSLCHDLGAAVDSLGFMSELARTRQSEFELGKNVLAYEDLEKGEEVWGPQIVDMLKQWNETHPDGYERSQPAKRQNGSAPKQSQPARKERAQRNSSSPEA